MNVLLLGFLFLVGLVVFFLILGKLTPGNGADLVDWDPVAMAERKLERQLRDQEELLRLSNEKRGRRGLPDLERRDLRDGELPL